MLQAFIDPVSMFGNTLIYKGLIRNMRYVRLATHRLERRALLLATTCGDTGFSRNLRYYLGTTSPPHPFFLRHWLVSTNSQLIN
jgi:hypothetical protein